MSDWEMVRGWYGVSWFWCKIMVHLLAFSQVQEPPSNTYSSISHSPTEWLLSYRIHTIDPNQVPMGKVLANAICAIQSLPVGPRTRLCLTETSLSCRVARANNLGFPSPHRCTPQSPMGRSCQRFQPHWGQMTRMANWVPRVQWKSWIRPSL